MLSRFLSLFVLKIRLVYHFILAFNNRKSRNKNNFSYYAIKYNNIIIFAKEKKINSIKI